MQNQLEFLSFLLLIKCKFLFCFQAPKKQESPNFCEVWATSNLIPPLVLKILKMEIDKIFAKIIFFVGENY
jgi:hypothetical protein